MTIKFRDIRDFQTNNIPKCLACKESTCDNCKYIKEQMQYNKYLEEAFGCNTVDCHLDCEPYIDCNKKK